MGKTVLIGLMGILIFIRDSKSFNWPLVLSSMDFRSLKQACRAKIIIIFFFALRSMVFFVG